MLKPLTRPRRLRRGDKVAIVAPSGPLDLERLARGVELFTELGMQVVTGAHVGERDGYLAGSDAQRAADLQAAWCDLDVHAVICARGGYGAARMVDLLDWSAMAARNAAVGPPVFLGCSDITTLHLAIARHLGVATLWGPMAAGSVLVGEEPDMATLRHMVKTLAEPETVQLLGGMGVRALCPGTARGVTVGGTISLLAASVGTPESIDGAGGVLLLEDIDESVYRIDRMLTHLLRSGALDGLAAVVAGDWVNSGDSDEIDALLVDRLSPLGIPVLAGFPVGHGPVQTTFPLGVEVDVDAAKGIVTLPEPALI